MAEEKKYSFKIRRGLESPLCIQGMGVKYFYSLAVVTGVLIFYMVGKLLSLVNNMDSDSFISFVLSLVICFAIIIGLKFYFTTQTNKKKLKFGKKVRTISNIDILNSL